MIPHYHVHFRKDCGPLQLMSDLLRCFHIKLGPSHAWVLGGTGNIHPGLPQGALVCDDHIQDAVMCQSWVHVGDDPLLPEIHLESVVEGYLVVGRLSGFEFGIQTSLSLS